MRRGCEVDVRLVADRATRRDWIAVPERVMAGLPGWVQPLRLMERQRISPAHNPFFKAGEAAFLIAYRDGVPVGRISAQVNRAYLEKQANATGHFGFFDCADDTAAAKALVEHAARWLRDRGAARMEGPFNLTINQETGLLVSGFEHRAAIMTPHGPPWAARQLESCGLAKVIDLLAFRMTPAEAPEPVMRLARLARDSGRVRIRHVDLDRYADEATLIFDIFNDAWSDNWGFVPVSATDREAMARDMRPIMRSKFAFIAEIDGEPAAMMVALPDINEVIAPLGGRLLPFNWARLAWAVWRDDWRTARVPLLGIRKRYRGTPLAAGVLSMMVSELLALGRQYDLEWVEFSWVLETNRAMIAIAELGAGKATKTFRIFGRDIGPAAPSV